MNSSNTKRNRNRSSMTTHTNVQNNSRSQLRQNPKNEKTSAEGVYSNGRIMHATTSLVGCLVQVEVKDGTKYEGILRTFSPDFELVIDYVTKVEPNVIPIVGSNIANLLASLQANNKVSQTLIFKFVDVVKLNAINVDLDYATSKTHMMTDTEISRFDGRQVVRDKELIPWEAEQVESEETSHFEELEDHNGTNAQNGWSPDDMFKINEERFKVRSTFDSSLKDYTMPLVKGEGEDYEQRQAQAEKIAHEIEGDAMRTERYAKEDADDEERYSSVVRPNDNFQHNRHTNRRKPANAQSSGNYNANSGGSSGSRSNKNSSNATLTASSPPFHSSNKNSSYSKQQFANSSSINSPPTPPTPTSIPSYQSQNKSQSNSQQSYREEISEGKAQYAGVVASNYSNQLYSKADSEETPPHTPHAPHTTHASHGSVPPNQHPLPQRNISENRRGLGSSKRKEEVAADLKKFSNDFKLPSNASNADNSKENVNIKSEPHVKNSNISAKNKSPVESTPVKDKSETVNNDTNDKELGETTIECVSPLSSTITAEGEGAKKSTLNPNAKVFTPRSPLAPVNTSSTPPSVASTPSSTVSSVQMTPQLAHQPQHHHHQQQQHQQQPRFSNPVVQLPQYNVLPPGLTLPIGPNQYLIPNVATMTQTFAQSNANQQRNYRTKGPQQYTNHTVRHDFSQPSAHVAAANVTGHPVLATAPIAAPQQIPVSYQQQPSGMVTPQGPPQAIYQHMYPGFHPRMNVLPPQATAMGMAAMQHAVQYDPSQLQHLYTTGTVQLQQIVSQAHHHVSNNSGHSAPTTPQSNTPTTPLHGGPAPSPVHHQPNQPPTPTPQQQLVYATSPHNPQGGVGHSNAGAQYHQQLVLIPSSQAVGVGGGHHTSGHGGAIHPHALSHSSTPGNHHGGPPPALLPVQLLTNAAAHPNALAATFNPNPGV